MTDTPEVTPETKSDADRIAKVMARAGVASRREAERMIIEGRINESPSQDVVGFRDRLEEATYSARGNRSGTPGASAPAARSAAVVVNAPAAEPAGAQTAPLNSSAQPAAQQGFQPVSEGEIRTETLD